jgi:hypothetical protein
MWAARQNSSCKYASGNSFFMGLLYCFIKVCKRIVSFLHVIAQVS